MQLISFRLRHAQKSCSGAKRLTPAEQPREGVQDVPLAVGISCVVIAAVARGDTRIVSLVSDQMIHSGKARSAAGHVSACFGLCSLYSSILLWQVAWQEKQLLSKGWSNLERALNKL